MKTFKFFLKYTGKTVGAGTVNFEKLEPEPEPKFDKLEPEPHKNRPTPQQ
jgi:hypothetical protein